MIRKHCRDHLDRIEAQSLALSVEQSTSGGPTGYQDDPPSSRCKGSLQIQDLREGDVAGKGRVRRLIDSLPVQAHDGRVSCTNTYQQSHLPSVLYMHTSLIMLYSISASQPVLRQEGCPTMSAIWTKPN
jgi:hypothetical protein